MTLKKRTVLFSLIVMCIILVSGTIASAAPGGGGQKYYVNGYVKTSSGAPISGAKVMLYKDGSYMSTTYTSSNGYFSGSTYSYVVIRSWKAVVSKSGYVTETKTVRASAGSTTSMGTIYLNFYTPPPPPPPAKPVINQVHETGQGFENGIEYYVTWGSTSTQYEVKFYWSEDATIDENDLYVTHTDSAVYYDESPLPMSWTDSEYWFKIQARSANTGGWSTTEVHGPQLVELKYYPTDDATVDSEYPSTTFNNDDLIVRHDTTDYENPETQQPLLKFSIPGTNAVKSAVLRMWSRSVYSDGHGNIYVMPINKQANKEFLEESVTWNSLSWPWEGEGFVLHHEENLLGWDEWDVTEFIHSGETSLCLHVGSYDAEQGSEYYSKDYWNRDKWPHLVVEYAGVPETSPLGSYTQYYDFQDDEFVNPTLSPVWHHSVTTVTPVWEPTINSEGFYFTQVPISSEFVTGHYYDQDELYIDGPFTLQVNIGTKAISSAEYFMQIGIEIYDTDSEIIADLYYQRFGRDISLWGGIGHIADYCEEMFAYTSHPTSFDPITDTGMLEITRDINNNVSLTFYRNLESGFPHIIPLAVNDKAIGSVRLKVKAAQTDPGWGFECWFDSVREIKTFQMGDPTGISAPFNIPLEEHEFEGSVLNEWKDEYGETPDGVSSTEYSVRTGFKSWALSVPRSSCELQQTITGNTLNAIEDQYLSFSYWAHSFAYDIGMRAVIEYLVTGNSIPTVVMGEWTHFTSTSPDWEEISVSTQYPIPSDVTYTKVRIIGKATTATQFNAYVDEARLSIIRPSSVDSRYCFVNGEECGFLTYSLGVIHAAKPSNYEFTVIPTILAQSINSYYIGNIGMEFSVDSSDTNHATVLSGQVIESNDKNAAHTGLDPASWVDMIPWIKNGAKWGTRIALYASNIGAPFSWIIGDIVAEGVDYILEPYSRDADTEMAISGNPGLIDISYSPVSNVIVAQCASQIDWDVNSDVTEPVDITVTFHVWWCKGSYPDIDTYYQTHSMRITFCHGVY